MKYTSYLNIIDLLDIKSGDNIYISSDIMKLAYSCYQNGEKFDGNKFIDSIVKRIGSSGSIVFPTFNWGFCKNQTFDYCKTLSKTGSLSNIALRRNDFRRTKHPIYSFAVYGKDKQLLTSLENISSFGSDSPFQYFYSNNYKLLFIGLEYYGVTFLHYIEEKVDVPYRFHKNFTSKYIDEFGNQSAKTYSMFVRYNNIKNELYLDKMAELYRANGISTEYNINSIPFQILNIREACDIIEDDIVNNDGRNTTDWHIERVNHKHKLIGKGLYKFAKIFYPICRSITGDGVRKSLKILQEFVPELQIHEVPTGTKVFDWEIPKEWSINDAFVKKINSDDSDVRIIDFNKSNLSVLGYSTPVDKVVTGDELAKYLYTLPEQPNAIPYVTSYYKERFGFCLSENERNKLDLTENAKYHICIDSNLKDGHLTYGELVIPRVGGGEDKEIFFSTYICHPSMGNNETSGPTVLIHLAKYLLQQKNLRYSYRIIFIPETIGSITYLSRNIDIMKTRIVAGFNITCVGDNNCYSYIPSKKGDTLADKVALNILKSVDNVNKYSFLERGSDERQYCAPLIDLPVCSVMRSMYGKYSEYHTSLDDMNFISQEGLDGAFTFYIRCINALENNFYLKSKFYCEPQLGKRELYPDISMKGSASNVRTMMNLITYSDGKLDLIDISNIIDEDIEDLIAIADKLIRKGVLERYDNKCS